MKCAPRAKPNKRGHSEILLAYLNNVMASLELITLVTVLNLFKIQILTHVHHCEFIVQIIQDSPLMSYQIDASLSNSDVTLLLPLDDLATLTYTSKFHRFCALIIHQIQNYTAKSDPEEEGIEQFEWPRASGSSKTDFHIFLLNAMNFADEEAILSFAKATRRILKSYFVIARDLNVDVYTLKSLGEALVYASSNLNTSAEDNIVVKDQALDYEGSDLVLLICGRCGGLEHFKSTGNWLYYTEGLIYELTVAVNATLGYEKLFALPRNGKTEDDTWDVWFEPLIEGSAAIATLQAHTTEGSQVVLFSRPAMYETAAFVTAKPKIKIGQALSRLVQPVTWGVWLGFLLSILLLFLILETSMHLNRDREVQLNYRRFSVISFRARRSTSANIEMVIFKSMLPQHDCRLTFWALVKPAIDQDGLSSRIFRTNIARDVLCMCLLAMWFLLMIVLNCGYKSVMTALVVMPAYTSLPQTFKELAYSDFKLFAVIWADNLEENFIAFDRDYTNKITERVLEFHPLESDCYSAIFKDKAACIAYQGALRALGLVYMTDIFGQRLYVESKEAIFTRTINYAVSKHYTAVLDKLNFIIRSLEATGVIFKWTVNQQQYNIHSGRDYAKKHLQEFKFYAGDHTIEDNEGDESVVLLLVQVMVLGFGTSLWIFVIEVLIQASKLFALKVRYALDRFDKLSGINCID